MALTIHFIDVGQGDATFLAYDAPDDIRRHILIDGGPAAPSNRVIPYLVSQGVQRLHLVVATHIDDDHIGGLLDVLAQFPVARFWGPDPHASDVPRPLIQASHRTAAQASSDVRIESVNTYDRLHALALSRNVVVEYPVLGHNGSYLFPGLELKVMGPAANAASALVATAPSDPDRAKGILSTSINNASIVLRIGVDGQFVLLGGDAEQDEWHAMLDYWGAGLHSRILKVSHHGSATGTDAHVLAAVRPREAVISVGPNSYGHPDNNVLSLLCPPIQLHRTDLDGTIVIRLGQAGAPPVPATRPWWRRFFDWLFRRG